LIQHSAGSGKSNSIAWLAHQLISLTKDDAAVFDSIIVVTDRKILDKQIRDTIKQFAQVSATVGAVTEGSAQLREFIEGGKKIVISTVQKFPFILDELGNEQRKRRFAIIDEAHPRLRADAPAAMSMALSRRPGTEDDDQRRTRSTASWSRGSRLPERELLATTTPKNRHLRFLASHSRMVVTLSIGHSTATR
jgi:type I restriction enzyme R subunit